MGAEGAWHLHCNPLQGHYRVELLHREIPVVITGIGFAEYNFFSVLVTFFPCFINVQSVALIPVMCTEMGLQCVVVWKSVKVKQKKKNSRTRFLSKKSTPSRALSSKLHHCTEVTLMHLSTIIFTFDTYQGVLTVVMKNWEPLVSCPLFAIERTYLLCFNWKFSSWNLSP